MAFFSSGKSLIFRASTIAFDSSSWSAKMSVRVAVIAFGPDVVACRAIDKLRRNAHPATGLADATLQHMADVEFARDVADIDRLTFEQESRVPRSDTQGGNLRRSVVISSLMPSLKYSCSASPLILWNGKTQTETSRIERRGFSLLGPRSPASAATLATNLRQPGASVSPVQPLKSAQ